MSHALRSGMPLLTRTRRAGELFVRALVRRIALRVAEEARPRSRTRTAEAEALAIPRTTARTNAPVLAAQNSSPFGSPDAAVRMLFGAFLPQDLPVQKRSAGWHAQQHDNRS